MANIAFDDGRLINADNFEILDNPRRVLSMKDQKSMVVAERYCSKLPHFGCVLVRDEQLAGMAIGFTKEEACKNAAEMVPQYYKNKGEDQPDGGIVAALGFTPDTHMLWPLMEAGVDVLFLLKNFEEEKSGDESFFKKWWCGPKQNPGLYSKFPVIRERHIFVQPRWTRMDKIYKKLAEAK